MEVFSFILLIYYLWSTTVQDFAWSAPTEAGLTDHAWSLDELVRSLRQRKAEAGSMSNTVYMLWFEQERDDCDDCELFEANGLSLNGCHPRRRHLLYLIASTFLLGTRDARRIRSGVRKW